MINQYFKKPLSPKQLLNLLINKKMEDQYCEQQLMEKKNIIKLKDQIIEYQTKIKQINSKNRSILTIIQKRDSKIRELQQTSNQRKKIQLKLQIQKNRLRSLTSQAQASKRNNLKETYRFYFHNNQQIKFKISEIKQYIQKMECQNKKLLQQKNTFKLIEIRQNSVQNLSRQWFNKVECIKKEFLTDQMEFNRLKIMYQAKQLINKCPMEAKQKLNRCESLSNLSNLSNTIGFLKSKTIAKINETDTNEKKLFKVKSYTNKNFYPSYQSIYK